MIFICFMDDENGMDLLDRNRFFGSCLAHVKYEFLAKTRKEN